jgi:hypothetical protein
MMGDAMSNRPGRLTAAAREDLAAFVTELRGKGVRWKTLEAMCGMGRLQLWRLMKQNSPLMKHHRDCGTGIAA